MPTFARRLAFVVGEKWVAVKKVHMLTRHAQHIMSVLHVATFATCA